MSQDTLIKLKSDKSKLIIRTVKNKKQNPEKLELKKYDKTLRKHVLFGETKK
jgi:large subunit ribosomal protein L33